MRNLLRDVRFGVRLLARNPGFTAIAVLTLGLGIGANTAIFSVVYGTLIEPLPYHDPEQLVMVWSKPQPDSRNAAAAGDFLEWRAAEHGVPGAARLDGPERQPGDRKRSARADPGRAGHAGLDPELRPALCSSGAISCPRKARSGRTTSVILSHSAVAGAVRRRPGRSSAGRSGSTAGRTPSWACSRRGPARPRSSTGSTCRSRSRPSRSTTTSTGCSVMGRLKPGVTLAQANAEMSADREPDRRGAPGVQEGLGHQRRAAAEQLPAAQHDPRAVVPARGRELRAADRLRERRQPAARARGACASARSRCARRSGASPRHIATQFLAESVVLAGLGGLFGIALARGVHAAVPGRDAGLHAALRGGRAAERPRAGSSAWRRRCVSGVLFGCAPAWQATRQNLNETLKEGGRSIQAGRKRHAARARGGRVRARAHAPGRRGLAVHSLMNLSRVELGFPTERLLTFFLPVPPTRLRGRRADPALPRASSTSGSRRCPACSRSRSSTGAPLQGGFGMAFNIVGRPVAQGSQRDGARLRDGDARLLPDLRPADRQRGRGFTERDSRGEPARRAWSTRPSSSATSTGVDPLAQRVAVDELTPGQARLGAAGRVADRRRRPRRAQRRPAQRDAAGDRRAVRAEPVAVGRA